MSRRTTTSNGNQWAGWIGGTCFALIAIPLLVILVVHLAGLLAGFVIGGLLIFLGVVLVWLSIGAAGAASQLGVGAFLRAGFGSIQSANAQTALATSAGIVIGACVLGSWNHFWFTPLPPQTTIDFPNGKKEGQSRWQRATRKPSASRSPKGLGERFDKAFQLGAASAAKPACILGGIVGIIAAIAALVPWGQTRIRASAGSPSPN